MVSRRQRVARTLVPFVLVATNEKTGAKASPANVAYDGIWGRRFFRQLLGDLIHDSSRPLPEGGMRWG